MDLKISLDEYLKKYLPADHNEQDIIYLKARHKWQNKEREENIDYHEAVSKHYKGTTFQLRN